MSSCLVVLEHREVFRCSQDSIYLPDLLLMPQLEDAHVFQALDADITNIFHDGVALGSVVGDWGGL